MALTRFTDTFSIYKNNNNCFEHHQDFFQESYIWAGVAVTSDSSHIFVSTLYYDQEHILMKNTNGDYVENDRFLTNNYVYNSIMTEDRKWIFFGGILGRIKIY